MRLDFLLPPFNAGLKLSAYVFNDFCAFFRRLDKLVLKRHSVFFNRLIVSSIELQFALILPRSSFPDEGAESNTAAPPINPPTKRPVKRERPSAI